MTKKLFLEPHYGDIAWSCGGLLYKYKGESIILNFFPPKKMKKFLFRKIKIKSRLGKKNNEKFRKLFNLKIIYLDYQSAFLRGRSDKNLFDKRLTSEEEELVSKIREDITKFVSQEKITEIYCPYAQRYQVDHLILRKAISTISIPEVIVYYYEDFPNFHPKSEEIVNPNLEVNKIDISDYIEKKIEAVLIYDNLVKAFFTNKETLIELIHNRPYETYWKEKENNR